MYTKKQFPRISVPSLNQFIKNFVNSNDNLINLRNIFFFTLKTIHQIRNPRNKNCYLGETARPISIFVFPNMYLVH
jgi:hypothetical protein